MSTFLREVRVALTPRAWQLRTRLANDAIVSGRNRVGYGGRGVYIFRDALEVEGAGAQVLAGADETFRKFRPISQLETEHLDPKLDLPG
jgi:hypothetical protein